ncbi:MAG: tripartite tricarboxylate transporter TctB family protein [Sphaerochaetaceae bacterium]|nr:tripartite tricarboxylate transporter TctB family protein [Sphaerochaetaceae bacterium]
MKEITLKKNLTSGIIAVVTGIVLWFMIPYCIKAKVTYVTSSIGPTYMPKLIIGVMTICGLGLIFQSLVLKKDETVTICIKDELRVLVYLGVLIAYIVLLPIVGFVVASILFACVSLYLMESKNKKYYIAAFAIVIAVFLGFKYGLSVYLPTLFI